MILCYRFSSREYARAHSMFSGILIGAVESGKIQAGLRTNLFVGKKDRESIVALLIPTHIKSERDEFFESGAYKEVRIKSRMVKVPDAIREAMSSLTEEDMLDSCLDLLDMQSVDAVSSEVGALDLCSKEFSAAPLSDNEDIYVEDKQGTKF